MVIIKVISEKFLPYDQRRLQASLEMMNKKLFTAIIRFNIYQLL